MSSDQVSRRTVVSGVAWAVPAVTVAAAAPAFAASLIKFPGINGWVSNRTEPRGGRDYYLYVTSIASGSTPDGAPYGLYVYDTEWENVIYNARLTYWIIGEQNATITTRDGHSSCWGSGVRGTPQFKADGLLYTPYVFNYNCPIDPHTAVLDPDGGYRLYLGDFNVRFSFRQSTANADNVTFWTQRAITIDRDGAGPEAPQVHTFERRNGTLGPYTPRSRSARSVESEVTKSVLAS